MGIEVKRGALFWLAPPNPPPPPGNPASLRPYRSEPWPEGGPGNGMCNCILANADIIGISITITVGTYVYISTYMCVPCHCSVLHKGLALGVTPQVTSYHLLTSRMHSPLHIPLLHHVLKGRVSREMCVLERVRKIMIVHQ